jgi:hypothetical protein
MMTKFHLKKMKISKTLLTKLSRINEIAVTVPCHSFSQMISVSRSRVTHSVRWSVSRRVSKRD